jgi:hypothetical protein
VDNEWRRLVISFATDGFGLFIFLYKHPDFDIINGFSCPSACIGSLFDVIWLQNWWRKRGKCKKVHCTLTQMASDQIIPCPYRFLGVTNGFSCFLASIFPLYDVLCSKADGEREEKVNVGKD